MCKWGVKSTDNQLQAREHWKLSKQHAHMNGTLSYHDCTSITVLFKARLELIIKGRKELIIQ